MKHGGRKKRDAIPVYDATEEEVLMGSMTPRPGVSTCRPQAVPLTPRFKAPQTPAPKRKYEDLVIPSGGLLIKGRWASSGEIPSQGSQAASSDDTEERERERETARQRNRRKKTKRSQEKIMV